MKLRVSIGATVMARMAAPIREKVLVSTRGENSFLSWPVRNSMGAKDMIMMITEKNMDLPTVREESSMIEILSWSGISRV
jgi:hypothetical protein